MKNVIVGFSFVLLLFCLTGMSIAQEMDINTKWQLYNSESKNPWLAVGAAWLLPTLGHAYAGDWGRGLPFLGAEVAGWALMMSSISVSSTGSSINTSQYGLGLGIFLVARIWEYIDAYATAEDTNRELKKKYGLTLILRDSSPALAFNYRL